MHVAVRAATKQLMEMCEERFTRIEQRISRMESAKAAMASQQRQVPATVKPMELPLPSDEGEESVLEPEPQPAVVGEPMQEVNMHTPIEQQAPEQPIPHERGEKILGHESLDKVHVDDEEHMEAAASQASDDVIFLDDVDLMHGDDEHKQQDSGNVDLASRAAGRNSSTSATTTFATSAMPRCATAVPTAGVSLLMQATHSSAGAGGGKPRAATPEREGKGRAGPPRRRAAAQQPPFEEASRGRGEGAKKSSQTVQVAPKPVWAVAHSVSQPIADAMSKRAGDAKVIDISDDEQPQVATHTWAEPCRPWPEDLRPKYEKVHRCLKGYRSKLDRDGPNHQLIVKCMAFQEQAMRMLPTDCPAALELSDLIECTIRRAIEMEASEIVQS